MSLSPQKTLEQSVAIPWMYFGQLPILWVTLTLKLFCWTDSTMPLSLFLRRLCCITPTHPIAMPSVKWAGSQYICLRSMLRWKSSLALIKPGCPHIVVAHTDPSSFLHRNYIKGATCWPEKQLASEKNEGWNFKSFLGSLKGQKYNVWDVIESWLFCQEKWNNMI